MTRIFTEGNTQTYCNIFYLISASETEAIDQSNSITAVVKPEKKQQSSFIAKSKQFHCKAAFQQRFIFRRDRDCYITGFH